MKFPLHFSVLMSVFLSACGSSQFAPAQSNFPVVNNSPTLLQSQSTSSAFRFQRIGHFSAQVNTSSLVNITVDYDVQYGEQVLARKTAFRYNLTDKQVVWVEDRGGDTSKWDQIKAESVALMKLKLKL